MTGKELKELRLSKGISSAKMVELTGLTRMTIYNIERRKKVKEDRVIFYKKILDCYGDNV